jgi:hypothetical protein
MALLAWLPQVIQALEPWISSEIEKGVRWGPELAKQLEHTRFGLICLTPDSLRAPWLLFEAGALSKTPDARVWTLLLGVAPEDVPAPLGQFQFTTTQQDDVRRLIQAVNTALEAQTGRGVPDTVLERAFTTHWPELAAELVAASQLSGLRHEVSQPPSHEVLSELLTTVRELRRVTEIRVRRHGQPGTWPETAFVRLPFEGSTEDDLERAYADLSQLASIVEIHDTRDKHGRNRRIVIEFVRSASSQSAVETTLRGLGFKPPFFTTTSWAEATARYE